MKYDINTVIELTDEGKSQYNKLDNRFNYVSGTMYPKYFIIISNDLKHLIQCKELNNNYTYFFKKEWVIISKTYYRKEKLKKIRNEV